MKTARDKTVWKVRVLMRARTGWTAKTYFYSREFHVTDWRDKAKRNPQMFQIDFIGKYTLEEDSA